MAQDMRTSSFGESRSLIDASERPLHRSPPGMPHKQEEWPVLDPKEQSSKSFPPEKNDRQQNLPGPSAAKTIKLGQFERFPNLNSFSQPAAQSDTYPVSSETARGHVRRKPVPTTPSSLPNTPGVSNKGVTTEPDAQTLSGPSSTANTQTTFPDLSAGAAAVEKSMYESSSTWQPRQTRTSELRARLSQGQVIKDSPTNKSKVVGFTDFTVDSAGMATLDAPAETRDPPVTPGRTRLYGNNASKESLRDTKGSSSFFGGGARLGAIRHPSRFSPKDQAKAPSPPQVPGPSRRANPLILDPSEVSTVPLRRRAPELIQAHRSSIPRSRPTPSSAKSRSGLRETMTTRNNAANIGSSAQASTQTSFLENATTEQTCHELFDSILDMPYPDEADHKPESTKVTKPQSGLEPIQESPRAESPHAEFEVSQHSMGSVDSGPIIQLHENADKVITVGNPDEEGNHGGSPRKHNLFPSLGEETSIQQDPENGGPSTDVNNQLLTSSSVGLPQEASPISRVESDTRGGGRENEDFEYFLSKGRLRLGGASTTQDFATNDTSTSDDPFFVASSDKGKGREVSSHETLQLSVQRDLEQRIPAQVEPWMSPLLGRGFDNPEEHIDGETAKEQIATRDRTADDWVTMEDNVPAVTKSTMSPSGAAIPPRAESLNLPDNSVDDELLESGPTRGDVQGNPLARTSKKSRGSTSLKGVSDVRDFFYARHRVTKPPFSPKKMRRGSLRVSGPAGKRPSAIPARKSPAAVPPSKSLPAVPAGKSPSVVPAGQSSAAAQSSIRPVGQSTLALTNRLLGPDEPARVGTHVQTAAIPPIPVPMASETRAAVVIAMQLMESARNEQSAVRRDRLMQLSAMMYEAINQGTNAEQALEQAKDAVRRAEVASALCKEVLRDICRRVEQGYDDS